MHRTALKLVLSLCVFSFVASATVPFLLCQNALCKPSLEESVANPQTDAAPIGIKPAISNEQLKQFADAVASSNTMLSCRKMDNQITVAYQSQAIGNEFAARLLQQILEKERQLIGPNKVEIAYTLSNLAGCSSPDQAFKLRKEALAIATAQLSSKDKFVQRVRYDLARSVALEKRGAAMLLTVTPECPHCHNNKSVVPVVGLVPLRQKDHGYLFVNRGCGFGGPSWYCRKCTGAFFPYTTDEFIMDEFGVGK